MCNIVYSLENIALYNVGYVLYILHCISVPPKPGRAENTEKCWTRGAAPSSTFPVFSARPGLGYGTLTLYHSRYFLLILVVLTVTKPMYHRHTKVDICAWWTLTNVTSVKVARPWYNVKCSLHRLPLPWPILESPWLEPSRWLILNSQHPHRRHNSV